jgi:hypothetical protein
MRTLRLESPPAPPPKMTEQRPAPTSPPLRSRAEQIADELAAQNRDPEPTIRRLPDQEPPGKPQVPGR